MINMKTNSNFLVSSACSILRYKTLLFNWFDFLPSLKVPFEVRERNSRHSRFKINVTPIFFIKKFRWKLILTDRLIKLAGELRNIAVIYIVVCKNLNKRAVKI